MAGNRRHDILFAIGIAFMAMSSSSGFEQWVYVIGRFRRHRRGKNGIRRGLSVRSDGIVLTMLSCSAKAISVICLILTKDITTRLGRTCRYTRTRRSRVPFRLLVTRWRCRFWAACTIHILECKFPTGTGDSFGENAPLRALHRVPLIGDSESRASRIKARVTGAAPWTNSAPPSAGYPNSCADSGYIRPPHRSRASRTVTFLFERASSRAAIRPAAPAPTIRKWELERAIDHKTAFWDVASLIRWFHQSLCRRNGSRSDSKGRINHAKSRPPHCAPTWSRAFTSLTGFGPTS